MTCKISKIVSKYTKTEKNISITEEMNTKCEQKNVAISNKMFNFALDFLI